MASKSPLQATADGLPTTQPGRVSFSDILASSPRAQQQQQQRAPSNAALRVQPFAPAFSFGPTRIPLVPDAIRGYELPELKDPLAFMELCPVRGVGAFVAGGVMGLLFGAVFAGMGSMAPYDPALRDWQQAQARADAGLRAAQARAGGHVVSGTHPPPPLNPFAPVYIPGVTHPPSPSPPLLVSSTAQGMAESAAHLAEPPPTPLLQAFKEGLVNMKDRSLSSARNFAIMGGIYTTLECSMETVRGKKDIYNAMAAGFGTGAILAARAGPAAIVFGGAGFAAFSAVIEVASPYLFEH